MFPIPFNFPFRKKDGSISTIGNEIENGGSGGGGSAYVLPTASAEVKGGVKIGAGLTMDGEVLKNTNPTPATPYVLPVASANTLGGVKIGSGVSIDENGVISVSGGSGGVTVYDRYVSSRPIFKKGVTPNKYVISFITSNVGAVPQPSIDNTVFSTDEYNFSDVYIPEKYLLTEYPKFLESDIITALNAVLLNDSSSETVSSVVLSDSLENYKTLILQGCYNSSGANAFDTTIIYENPILNWGYWFGVKDRNNSYSGYLTFTDNTHASLSESRRIKIYGVPKTN